MNSHEWVLETTLLVMLCFIQNCSGCAKFVAQSCHLFKVGVRSESQEREETP